MGEQRKRKNNIRSNTDLVAMLRTPTGCVPPTQWELAVAAEIERLRAVIRVNGLRWGYTDADIEAVLHPASP